MKHIGHIDCYINDVWGGSTQNPITVIALLTMYGHKAQSVPL